MIKIGLIGAESTHAKAFMEIINKRSIVAGCEISYVWGETPELAQRLAETYEHIHIVSEQEEMIGKIDALIIAHRHGKHHIPSAMRFLDEKIPVFIDKPLCISSERGWNYLQQAKENNIAVASYSIIQFQHSVEIIKEKIHHIDSSRKVDIYGPAYLNELYGGLYFYGIHQVLLALDLFREDVEHVTTTEQTYEIVSRIVFQDEEIVDLHFVKHGLEGFALEYYMHDQLIHEKIEFDTNMFQKPVEIMLNMFSSGIMPFDYGSLIRPIAVMEAIVSSLNENCTIHPNTEISMEKCILI